MFSICRALAALLLLLSAGQVVAQTARTQTYFNDPTTGKLRDGQAAGSITPGIIRDFVASTYGGASNNVNLKNLGLPTGGDDTAATQTALTAALTAGTGGTVVSVYAPCGTYNHATMLIATGITLFGDGPCSNFVATDATSNSASMQMTGDKATFYNFQVSTTYTGARNDTTANAQAVQVNVATNFTVDHLFINGSAAGIIYVTGSSFGNITFNRMSNSLADGIHITNQSSDILVQGNIAQGLGDDCWAIASATGDINPVSRVRIEGNQCSNGLARGMVVNGGNDITWVGNTVDNSLLACMLVEGSNGGGGFTFLAANNVLYTANRCFGGGTLTNGHSAVRIGMDGTVTPVNNVKVTSNQFTEIQAGCLGVGNGAETHVHFFSFTDNDCWTATGAMETFTIAGTIAAGNVTTLTGTSASLPGSPVTVSYTAIAADVGHPENIAAGITKAINTNTNFGYTNTNATNSGTAVASIYTRPGITIAWTRTVAGSVTGTLAVGSSGNANSGMAGINGVESPRIIGNNFHGPDIYSGFNDSATTWNIGNIEVVNNTLDAISNSNANTLGGIDLQSTTWTSCIVKDNQQRNNGQTLGGPMPAFIHVAGCPKATVSDNHGDNTTQVVTGITNGRWDNPYATAGLTQSPRNVSTCSEAPGGGNTFTAQTPVITEEYFAEVYVPTSMTVTGVAILNSATISGNVKVGLADNTGAIVATSASTAMAGTSTYQRVPFTAAYIAAGGTTYYVVTMYDNTTVRPQTLTLGNCAAGKKTAQVFATGFTAVTPGSTFTTALGPVAGLY